MSKRHSAPPAIGASHARRPASSGEKPPAALICAATLLLKLLVPTGYMIDADHGRIAIAICSGTTPATMVIDMPGMHGDMADHGKPKDHGKPEMPCAFAGLSAAMTRAIDTIQPAADPGATIDHGAYQDADPGTRPAHPRRRSGQRLRRYSVTIRRSAVHPADRPRLPAEVDLDGLPMFAGN